MTNPYQTPLDDVMYVDDIFIENMSKSKREKTKAFAWSLSECLESLQETMDSLRRVELDGWNDSTRFRFDSEYSTLKDKFWLMRQEIGKLNRE